MLYRGIQDPSVGISVALAGFVIADVSFIISSRDIYYYELSLQVAVNKENSLHVNTIFGSLRMTTKQRSYF